MADKIVFILPDSLEDILWLAPVITQHLEDRLLGNIYFLPRPPEKITLVCKWPDLYPFLTACWKGVKVVEKVGRKEIDEADLLIKFDTEAAYKWSEAVHKPITLAFAYQLGTQSTYSFPPVAMVLGIEVPGLVLVVGNRSWMEGYQDLTWDFTSFLKLGEQQKIKMSSLYGGETWEEIREAVSQASVVVGVRGTATLIAAAMGKVVMELAPDSFHRDWTAKWSSSRYRMIYGNLMELPAEFILDRTGKLVKDLAKSGELTWVRRHSTSSGHKAQALVGESEQMAR